MMEVTQFLGLALSSLVMIVILHFVVYWVVKTMYPPAVPTAVAPLPIPVMPTPAPPPPQAFTEPPKVDNVTLPTYETPLPVETSREEEPRRGPPPPEETSIRRKSGMDAPNA